MKRHLHRMMLFILVAALCGGSSIFASPSPEPGGQEDGESAPKKREDDEAKPRKRTQAKKGKRRVPQKKERVKEKMPSEASPDEASEEAADGGTPEKANEATPEKAETTETTEADSAAERPSKEETAQSDGGLPPEKARMQPDRSLERPDTAAVPEKKREREPRGGERSMPDATDATESPSDRDAAIPPTKRPQPPGVRPHDRQAQPTLPRLPPTSPPMPPIDRQKPALADPGGAFETIRASDKATDLRLTWEIAGVWGILLLLLLAWVAQLFPFFIPFGALRFFSVFAHFLAFGGFLALGGLLLYRALWFWVPGDTLYTGALGFSFAALGSYFWKRRAFPHVYIGLLPLLLVVLAALLWGLSTPVESPESRAWTASPSWLFLIAQVFLFASFGLFATSGAFLLTSGLLGFLAKKGRGKGYGLSPLEWGDFQLQAPTLALVAFPLFTVSVVFSLIWSLQQGDAWWSSLTRTPRTIAALGIWWLLASWVVALRIPRPSEGKDIPLSEAPSLEDEGPDPSLVLLATSRPFPSLWLLVTLLASAALFVLAPALSRLFQGQ